MSYGVKYTIPYARRGGGLTTIDILKKSYSSTIYELTPDGVPLLIDYSGSADNIFSPSIGTGATISFLVTPLSMTEFFTNDPQLFIVNIYDGVSGSTLKWQGFVSPEIYNENYSYSTDLNVPITIQCNDGMATLENILYLQSDGSYYTGTATLATIFGNILGKLGITFTNIYTSTDLIIKPYVTNLFLYLNLPQENFIDEQGIAMTCRQVLEEIVLGLGDGLIIRFLAGNIYIYNPICLHTPSKGKSYDASTFGYEASSAFGGYLDIANNEIQWYQTDSILDSVPIKGNVSVKYDPYTYLGYEYDFSDSANWTTPGTFAEYNEDGLYYRADLVYKDWTFPYGYNISIAIKESLWDSPDYVIKLVNTDGYARYNFKNTNVTQDDNLQLKISVDVYIQTKSVYPNIYSANATHNIYSIELPVSVKVGNQYYHGGASKRYPTHNWSTSTTNIYQPLLVVQPHISYTTFVADPTKSQVNDQWINASMIVSLGKSIEGNLISGDITVTFLDTLKTFFAGQILPAGNATYLNLVLFKNLKLEFLDASTGLTIQNTGIGRNGVVSTNLLLKDVFEINTKCGIGTYGCSLGAFKTDEQTIPGINITGLYIGSTLYNTADIMLMNILGQYELSRSKLSGVLNVAGIDYALKLIKDTTYLGAKAFYIISSSYNDREESASVEMVEITSTRETKL
jgi:hypothetical protein